MAMKSAHRKRFEKGPRNRFPGPQGQTTSGAASPDRKSHRERKIAFAAISAAVLLAAGYFLWPVVKLSGLFTPAGKEVAIVVSMSGFSPSRIDVRKGEPLTIRLVNKDNRFHNDGGGWHQFAIDEIGLDVRVPPLTTRTFTFTPEKTGVFDFFCDVCCGGRANPYMHGALTVMA